MARKTKQQAQETRGKILETAISVFSAQGVSATSLADIANAAGVTRGAIYWHFKNKADLLNEIWASTEPEITTLETEYQSIFPDNPLQILREILIYILVTTVDDPRRKALMEIIFHKCEFVGEMLLLRDIHQSICIEGYDKIEIVLHECIEKQQLPRGLNIHRAAVALRSFMTGIMENWLFTPEHFDLKAEAALLIDGFLDMLRLSPAMCAAPVHGGKPDAVTRP
ncbi:multidrug efflux transporter transcriptional repressor AcrR [Enterobacillus tribolii]|uniref:TetR family transcriptional regulator n=1 Tax=Enterobacillus tribolii TaxID=1487935 RepID=A0A370QSC5_9GAMM|nr:multidrug efflux transporter transcriptional repressor AcrR [Enterobacillus tribolii]MBW7983794.1 DNA-binding transcriptional repressor AcrR [Enterobacillus tribolii]RDK92160.1 TetR family transcriptional regulator [Enterobacillus tribolii]